MPDNVRQLRPNQPEQWGGFFPSVSDRPPARRWLADGIIPYGELSLITGDPGSAKTTILLQMAISAALGQQWIGRQIDQVRSLGLFVDDDKAELERRTIRICDAYGVDYAALDDKLEFNPRDSLDLSAKLLTFDYDIPYWTKFGDTLWQKTEENGYGLIIIDTAAQAIGWPGGWKGDKATNVANLFRARARCHDCSIILSDHTAKANSAGFAGVNSWLGAVKAVMNIHTPIDEQTREPAKGKRILQAIKSNYSSWEPISLRWDKGILVAEDACERVSRPTTGSQWIEFYHDAIRYLGRLVAQHINVPVDEENRLSWPRRAHRKLRSDRGSRWHGVPLNDLCAAQQWALDHNLVAIVKVAGKYLIRPKEMRYDDE